MGSQRPFARLGSPSLLASAWQQTARMAASKMRGIWEGVWSSRPRACARRPVAARSCRRASCGCSPGRGRASISNCAGDCRGGRPGLAGHDRAGARRRPVGRSEPRDRAACRQRRGDVKRAKPWVVRWRVEGKGRARSLRTGSRHTHQLASVRGVAPSLECLGRLRSSRSGQDEMRFSRGTSRPSPPQPGRPLSQISSVD
jgi:hypothetical protein